MGQPKDGRPGKRCRKTDSSGRNLNSMVRVQHKSRFCASGGLQKYRRRSERHSSRRGCGALQELAVRLRLPSVSSRLGLEAGDWVAGLGRDWGEETVHVWFIRNG